MPGVPFDSPRLNSPEFWDSWGRRSLEPDDDEDEDYDNGYYDREPSPNDIPASAIEGPEFDDWSDPDHGIEHRLQSPHYDDYSPQENDWEHQIAKEGGVEEVFGPGYAELLGPLGVSRSRIREVADEARKQEHEEHRQGAILRQSEQYPRRVEDI